MAALMLITGVLVLQLPVLVPAWPVLLFAALLAGLAAMLRHRADALVVSICSGIALVAVSVGVTLSAANKWQQGLLPEDCERALVQVSGSVLGLPRAFEGDERVRYRLDFAVEQLLPERCIGPTKMRLYGEAETLPLSGEHLLLNARLRRPHGLVNPFTEVGEKRFLMQGIHAIGSIKGSPTLVAVSAADWKTTIARRRAEISSWIRQQVPGDSGSLLAALAVGDRRYIERVAWDRLRLYGLTHLLVISGLHVTLFALPGWWIGTFIQRCSGFHTAKSLLLRGLPLILASSLAATYALLAGFTLPVQRALLMLWLVGLPRLAGRPFSPGRMLAMAATSLFCLDPLSILGGAYWLSLGAVGVLFYVSTWQDRLAWPGKTAVAQGYILLWMIPLSLYWFQVGGGVGGLLNLVAIPWVSFWIVPTLLLSVFLHVLGSELATSVLSLSAGAFTLLWTAMAYWEGLLEPVGYFYRTLNPALLLLLLFACGVLVLPRFPGRAAIFALLWLPLAAVPERGRDLSVHLLFLDMGQGTAVLVRAGQNALLYDTGGGPPQGPAVAQWTLLPVLRALSVQKLDSLIISHPDRDHDAGTDSVEEAVDIVQRYYGRPPIGAIAKERCRMGKRVRLGDVGEIRFLSSAMIGDSDNNASCVIMLQAFGRSVLLPGDINAYRERELLAYWGDQLKPDVLMAAHHGSNSSSSALWLRSLDATLVMVNAAKSNRFGHPGEEVVARITASGGSVLNTAQRGAIALRIRPDGRLECASSRHSTRAFWRRGEHSRSCGVY